MILYELKVADQKGVRSIQHRQAPSVDVAIRDVQQEGLLVLGAREIDSQTKLNQEPIKLSKKQVLDFTASLNVLLDSGLGLKEALRLSLDIFKNKEPKDFVHFISKYIEKGGSLYDALRAYPRTFSPLYLSLVKIGEKVGDLGPVFSRLTEYLQTRKVLADKVGNALTYPILVLGVSIIGTVLLMTLVFPQLFSMIDSVNRESSVQIKQNMTNFQSGFTIAMVVLGVLVLVGLGIKGMQVLNQRIRIKWSTIILRIPLLRGILEVYHGLNFSFAMETLLLAGYSIEDSLSESALVVSNAAIKDKLSKIRTLVIKGVSFSEAVTSEGLFSDRFRTWLRVGETSGDLKKVFIQLRKYYQQEMDSMNTKAMNLVEPTMIILVGIFVLTLVLNFVTPIFSMLGNVVK